MDETDFLFPGNEARDVRGVVAPDRRYVLYKWHPVAARLGTLPADLLVSTLMCPDTRAPVLFLTLGFV